ncbi:class 1 isoprenoid biosynthesis enzyme [candidate division KSB1 bacterium]|nr:class 1 isoprenoid biosynthesis enzyme [candidate division KSB1 bacterium]
MGEVHSRKKSYYLPYWYFLPIWLVEKIKAEKKVAFSAHFVRDVLWAQYCLFITIRMMDDLYDQQAEDPALPYAALLFKLEADRIFLRYFRSTSRFWVAYRQYVCRTISAIVKVDSLQQSGRTKPAEILSGYEEICSIFKIGSLAVCSYSKCRHLLPAVFVYADALAGAGQAMDDLEDLQQDLVRGRYNYIATFLLSLPKSKKRQKGDIKNNGVETEDDLTKVFLHLSRYIQKAERTAQKMNCKGMMEYCQWVKEYMGSIQK